MPTGRVRYFDAEKGFGFLSKDGEAKTSTSALPRSRPG